MKLKVLASSSSGNCYILEADNGDQLMIEAGIRYIRIKEGLDFNLKNVLGCLVTHCHNDHSEAMEELINSGINVYSGKGTFEHKQIKLPNNFANIVQSKKPFKIGDFKILPFDVKHDAPEPLGYLIDHPESGNILFVTDTYYIPYRFDDLKHIMIECNYDEEILNEHVINNKAHPSLRKRVLYSHMELDTVIKYLDSIEITDLINIVLIHLSSGNSHAVNFKNTIESKVGKPVVIADKGVVVNFNECQF